MATLLYTTHTKHKPVYQITKSQDIRKASKSTHTLHQAPQSHCDKLSTLE